MSVSSQVRFIMHPLDEQAFAEFLLKDEAVVFVDGPRWPTSKPPSTRRIEEISTNYCIIWSREDIRRLRAQFMPTCNDWYCSSEHQTIQFLRSEMPNEVTLTVGRIAVSTPSTPTKSFPQESIARLERRYKAARTYIRKRYANSACWYNPKALIHMGTSERSVNPSLPAKDVWIGPAALDWLHQSDAHVACQVPGGPQLIPNERAAALQQSCVPVATAARTQPKKR